MSIPYPQAVIFDLDGVITDSAEHHFLAWQQLGQELSIPFDRQFNETLKGVNRMDSLERILSLGQANDRYSEVEKTALAEKKNRYYVESIQHLTPQDVLPGIIDLLKDLRQNKIKIAMASASKNAQFVSERLEVDHYFDHIVDAATVEKSKPHPEVFLKAATAVGVAPTDCVGIEDAAAGVKAIKSAGMRAIAIGDADILSAADLVLTDTSKLSLATLSGVFSK